MNRLLDTTLRDALRNAGCYALVGTVLWLPVIVALLRAQP